MALEDWIIVEQAAHKGGQGYVQKVHHRDNGRVGALKLLHAEPEPSTERRYRFLSEVSALRVLNGLGAPLVIDANETAWQDKNVKLYLVMEFIEGPTLTSLVSKSRPSLDQAILATKTVVSILGNGHRFLVHHRDIKPDNVMMRESSWDDPVLVDLGIAWYGGDAQTEFETPNGQELGNRFLRLPEYAPNGDHHDARSDLTMTAGLLYFMLAGMAPRQLVDQQGQHPHERFPSPFNSKLISDVRWRSVERFFYIAFQQDIGARFQTAGEVLEALARIDEAPKLNADDLEAELAKLRELSESKMMRDRAAAAPSMEKSSKTLSLELDRIWENAGLMAAAVYPRFTEHGATFVIECRVSLKGHDDPSVWFRHNVRLLDGRLIATWHVDQGSPEISHQGSAADTVGLEDALLAKSRQIAAEVIRLLMIKLQPPATLHFLEG